VGSDSLFDTLIEIVTTAERSGFSSVSVMDHLHQIAGVGPTENNMLEGNATLAALAARTSTVTLGLLVGGITYRNPALMAKITTTLDIISGGRVWHGIGAAWFEAEHNAYGFAYPPLKERFERLEEALQITRSMFTQPQTSFRGRYYTVDAAYNNPQPVRGDIPILIGGSGERKTLRLVAQYADGCNLFGDPDRVRHLLGVLERHCETVGRDPAEITKTGMGIVVVAPTHEAAQAKVEDLRKAGFPEERLNALLAGDPDTVGERVQALAEAGLEGITISMPYAHELEGVELAGQAIAPIFATTATA
jgi:F420-dependent oxidoreductase-like protein